MTMRLLPADSWGSKQQTLGFSWFQPPQCHIGMKTSESLRYPLSQLCHLERAPFHLQVLLVSPGDLKHFDSHMEVSDKMDGLQWKILLRWMIQGYHHFRKPPYIIMKSQLLVRKLSYESHLIGMLRWILGKLLEGSQNFKAQLDGFIADISFHWQKF